MNLLQPRCNCIVFLTVIFAFCLFIPRAQGQVVVGRVTVIEGELLRFIPENKDWLATVKDAPFGLEDSLYSGQDTRAEINMPNNAWIRLGGSTQVQLIAAETDGVEISVSSGVTRVMNESEDSLIKATTPFGYVVAQPGAAFDLYVGDQSAETIGVAGTVDFIHVANNAKYQATPGGTSIIADRDQVGTGDGTVDADWSAWNQSRDDLWSRRAAAPVESARYLPPHLKNDAYELEQNGRWERVVVEGRARDMWRPTVVVQGWAPFTAGRWTEWNGDQTWIPAESFGYTTHHYGNWQFVNNYWYWMPPPPTEIRVSWYPGRVAWVGSAENVGWVPLAPEEPYYGHHHWGPGAVVVGTVAVTAITVAALVNLRHTVVVPHEHFYGSVNYTSVRNVNVNTNVIINNYNSSHVVNKTIINNYNTNPARFASTNQVVHVKPHESALANIKHAPRDASLGVGPNRFGAGSLQQTLQATKVAVPSTKVSLPPPQITSKLVPASQVNLPPSKVNFTQINPKAQPVPVSTKITSPGINTDPNRTMTKTPGAMTQQPGAAGPHSPVGPRTPPASQTDPNKQLSKTPGTMTQQPSVTGPHSPVGPRTPPASQTDQNKKLTTAPGTMTQQPSVTGPHSPVGPRTPPASQTDQNKKLTTAPGTMTQQPSVAGPPPPVGPRTPPASQTDQNKKLSTTPGTMTQQPNVAGPPLPVGPRTPPASQTDQNKKLSTTPGTMTQQPNVAGPPPPVGPRTPPASQTVQNKQLTTTPGATTQQPGLTKPHTPPMDQMQQQQAEQQKLQQQQQQQKMQQQQAEQQKLQQQQQQQKMQQQQAEQQKLQQQQQQQKMQQQQAEQQKLQQQQQQQKMQQQQAEQQKLQQQQQQQKMQQQQAEQQKLQQQQQQQKMQQQQVEQQKLQQQQQKMHQQQPQMTAEQLRQLCLKNPNDPKCKK